MSDAEINVAIAEACPDIFGVHPESGEVFRWLDEEGIHIDTVDIVNDLNAMHGAESVLKREQRYEYIETLVSDTSDETTCDLDQRKAEWNLAHATARQRAEAFLRTVGKWKEQEMKG